MDLKDRFSLLFLFTLNIFFICRSSDSRYNFALCFRSYPDFAQCEQFLKSLSKAYPELARLKPIGISGQGRTIWALEVGSTRQVAGRAAADTSQQGSTSQPDRQKIRFLFTSLVHSNEWVSLPVVLYLAYQLVSRYQDDAEVKYILDHSSLWFVPLVNPDGYEYSRSSERNWRKNRSIYGHTPSGVDINRNFAWAWDLGKSSTLDPDSPFYRGPRAASEPETRALCGLAACIHFKAAIDFHSFGQRILYPYGYSKEACPDEMIFRTLAKEMAHEMAAAGGSAYSWMPLSSIYPHDLPTGTLMDYLYGTYGTLAFTVELAPQTQEQGGVQLATEKILDVAEENMALLKFLCRWIIEHR
jgi:carboxypeptidase T